MFGELPRVHVCAGTDNLADKSYAAKYRIRLREADELRLNINMHYFQGLVSSSHSLSLVARALQPPGRKSLNNT